MSLSDRITASEAELVSLKDQLTEVTKMLEAAPEEESLRIECEELTAKVNKHSNSVDALKKAEAALAARAVPVSAPTVISNVKKDGKGNGDLLFKMATSQFIAYSQRKDVGQVLAERYKDDSALSAAVDYVSKSVVNPAMTSTAGWAAELIQTDVQGFLDSLRTVSVAAELASRSQRLSFGGYDSITVPMRNPLGATLTEPAWVGEAGAIPLTQFQFSSAKINRYKLAAISTFSKELAERSTPQIEGLIRDALSEAYAQVLDAALLSNGAAVAGVRPAGLLAGVTGVAGTAGGGEAAVIADIKAGINAMTAARLGARPVLIINTASRLGLSLMMNPLGQRSFADEVATGRILGIEIISSQHVPANTAILVDAATFATAFDVPMFDVSDTATIVESNANGTAPTMAATAAQAAIGAVGTAGQVPVNSGIAVNGSTGAAVGGATPTYQARSLWQTWAVGVRMIAPTSWSLLRGAAAVHSTTAITW